ncbi:hypothetical protein Q7P37_010363 [Cladosporium fusiforme]
MTQSVTNRNAQVPSFSANLAGKTAIVTGSSRGIGAAIALDLGRRGANVIINYSTDKSKAAAEEVVKGIKSLNTDAQPVAVQSNISDAAGRQRLVDAAVAASPVQKIDILVHNAGNGDDRYLTDLDEEFFDMQIGLNVKAPTFLTQAALPHIPQGGRIIIISSVSARMGVPQQSVYAASKAGTEALARVWATELGQSRGITVNCVNPGPVSTEMFRASAPEFIEALKPLIDSTPAEARLGETSDIAPLVSFLASEESPGFSVQDAVYKTVNGHEISASVLLQEPIQSGKHPVIVRWHGGGLVNGHRLFAQWIAPYILDHARQTDAIMIFPDYRLLPGVESALDILDDVRDFFAWLFAGGLSEMLDRSISADLENVLVCGESAGGWLALQSGFIQGPAKIRAIISQYPMIDMRSDHWTVPGPDKYLQGAAFVDPERLKVYYEPGEQIVTSRIPPIGGEIYHSLVQRGLYGKAFGDDALLYPMESLEQGHSLPPLWLLHGSADTIVPPDGSTRFAEILRQGGNSPVNFTIIQGEEHLFDVDTGIDEDWVQDGLAFIGKYWPAVQLQSS